ncbi:hypothetical protein GALMADRAFT_209411 [Galerina marginata CBS 339.88]|uniref:Uncharacterized protein n=1 Tax=Galerina marginata (strain CBS 339.88) TaxID=685588 RepID=A0A067TG20_GALM3|nr:hypothetical protein GALMADRAFT_209411 [Galerina marginata CBS 339.88]
MQSPRKEFLDLIAPRWRIPRCTSGNLHNPGLCMGSTAPENIGRRYFYCNAGRSGRPVCAYGEETWSPILSAASQARLRNALNVFDNALTSKLSIRAATTQGLTTFRTEEKAACETAEFSHQLVNPPVEIDIFLYLEVHFAGDVYTQEKRSTKNGCYSLYSDSELCSLTNFPVRRWSVYDRFIKSFVPIPTFSNLTVIKGEFLVIRPSSFTDAHCQGLQKLLLKLQSRKLSEPQHLKRIRDQDAEPRPGSSKRARYDQDIIDLTDLE